MMQQQFDLSDFNWDQNILNNKIASFLQIKLIIKSMSNKQNVELSMSPCQKNRVRICSLNIQKRKALTQCSSELNAGPPSPAMHKSSSPKLITIQRKRTQESKAQENNQLNSGKKLRGRSIKTEAVEKKYQSSEQFDKLLEITSRCVDYYNKFLQIKDSELKVVKDAFADINESLNKAFNSIITEVNNKRDEIKQFLMKKENQLIKIKEQQQAELNFSLNDVKSVHLINLLRDYKTGDHSADLSEQICSYANTLHKFYESMQKIEKQNFKEGVQETINFINNVITEEIKFIIYEKIPSKSLNGSFSFNDGLGFGNSISSPIEPKIENQPNVQSSIVCDSLEHSLAEKLLSKKKEMRQGWTQTLIQNSVGKCSLLQTLNQITKSQESMKLKIEKYRCGNNF